jgi:hypothetical protein
LGDALENLIESTIELTTIESPSLVLDN